MGLTHLLSEMEDITFVSNHFNISLFTTSFIAGFSLGSGSIAQAPVI